jgi:hypothetical protein
MCAGLLLDPLQLYLEMSVVFGLSIYTATSNSSTVGNENVLLGFFVVGYFIKNVVLRVIAEKVKVCSYLCVGNILIHRMFPKG